MDDTFKIFIDRLQDGEQEVIEEKLNPDFLDIHEADLEFPSPVYLKGEAIMSKGMLILHFSISTEAVLPCSICNKDVKIPIEIKNFYHSEDIANIRSGVFNFTEILRETILLEIPYTTECHGGSCPERQDMAKYFKKNKPAGDEKEATYHPFADL